MGPLDKSKFRISLQNTSHRIKTKRQESTSSGLKRQQAALSKAVVGLLWTHTHGVCNNFTSPETASTVLVAEWWGGWLTKQPGAERRADVWPKARHSCSPLLHALDPKVEIVSFRNAKLSFPQRAYGGLSWPEGEGAKSAHRTERKRLGKGKFKRKAQSPLLIPTLWLVGMSPLHGFRLPIFSFTISLEVSRMLLGPTVPHTPPALVHHTPGPFFSTLLTSLSSISPTPT